MTKSAFNRLLITEAKLLLREPVLLFWGVAFPLGLTIVFGLAGDKPDTQLGGLTLVDAYLPVMMAFVLTVLAVQALPAILADYRERGVLRRLSTTPMRPELLLGADFIVDLAVVTAAVVVIATVAKLAFHVHLPSQALGFVVTLALTAVAMLSLGTLIGSVARNGRMAGALGTLLFFPMMFFAGLWVPREEMGTTLQHLSNFTPLGAAVASVQQTMHGSWPSAQHLLVLAVYAIVLSFAATRLFRWE
jgi:ABC-2 type transport system permease protein